MVALLRRDDEEEGVSHGGAGHSRDERFRDGLTGLFGCIAERFRGSEAGQPGLADRALRGSRAWPGQDLESPHASSR